jgi:hypothetical protein
MTLYPCVVNEPWLVALPRWQRRSAAWLSVTFICSLYYLIPAAVLAATALAAAGRIGVATAIATTLVALSVAPQTEWVAARRFCQVYYEIFDVKHNLSPDRVRRLVEDWSAGGRYILGMHPHGVVPIQTLIWAA